MTEGLRRRAHRVRRFDGNRLIVSERIQDVRLHDLQEKQEELSAEGPHHTEQDAYQDQPRRAVEIEQPHLRNLLVENLTCLRRDCDTTYEQLPLSRKTALLPDYCFAPHFQVPSKYSGYRVANISVRCRSSSGVQVNVDTPYGGYLICAAVMSRQ